MRHWQVVRTVEAVTRDTVQADTADAAAEMVPPIAATLHHCGSCGLDARRVVGTQVVSDTGGVALAIGATAHDVALQVPAGWIAELEAEVERVRAERGMLDSRIAELEAEVERLRAVALDALMPFSLAVTSARIAGQPGRAAFTWLTLGDLEDAQAAYEALQEPETPEPDLSDGPIPGEEQGD
jgi:hypothetical protein